MNILFQLNNFSKYAYIKLANIVYYKSSSQACILTAKHQIFLINLTSANILSRPIFLTECITLTKIIKLKKQ